MLSWLRKAPNDFRTRIRGLAAATPAIGRLEGLGDLAAHELHPTQVRLLSATICQTLTQLSLGEAEALGYLTIPIRFVAECTVQHLVAPLVVSGLRRRILFDVAVREYGDLQRALLNPDPSRGPPRFVVFVLNAERRAGDTYLPGGERTTGGAQVELAEIERLAQLATEQLGATAIFNSLAPIHGALFGNHEAVIGAGPAARANLLNEAMVERAREGRFLLWDVNALAAEIGRDRLIDIRLWRHAKMPIAPDAAPLAMEHLAALIAAALGRNRKVLVLDLDNTVWGGVIGDDGLDGIRLGHGSGEGEAFTAFQHYVKSLKNRGILIAVSSKNSHDICEAAIRQHPEMVLKMEDFTCFRVNWTNKADNLVEISRRLNLGLDALVFFDDSPVERELVRQQLPMVAVPEVPEDPALYVDCLSRARYFDAISLSTEDMRRQQQYAENEQRCAAMKQARDLSEFLRSLDMKIVIRGYDKLDLARITQLVNKTNQFNLTTRRYTESEIRSLGENPETILLTVRVEDRFGDNGLVSVVIARRSTCGGGFQIDSWLMSCRVLGRGVEQALMKTLVRVAAGRGGEFLLGCYLPTARNRIVETFYADQGFGADAQTHDSAPGARRWRLDLASYAEPPVYATLEACI